ncbi:hypothetical protein [Mycolicibacter heraklionensis]|uniref:Uncharacterized protein n=1 Tax=Mycolicibacter heraklionensis TaxID=512402 RepID=A0AA91IZF6_9MYCO|nr:hypothetical protein [Mycolicibacter heraklionensis]OBK88745.1 hypothetical protein A5649_15110 [Mycolicibacter heraklionensis]
MLQTLRPYLTPGIAVVGAGLIAVVPSVAPMPAAPTHFAQQQHSVVLTADPANDVTGLLTSWGLLPTITVNAVPLPAQINIELGSTLHNLLAMIGPFITLNNAWNDIMDQLAADPANAFMILLNAPGTLINAFLFGTSGIDVAGMNIPLFNGLFVAPHTATIDLQLGQLVDLAGVGNTTLGDVLGQFGIGDESVEGLLTGLLDSLGFGHLSVTALLSEFGIGDQPIADLAANLLDVMGIGNPTISGLADQVGLGDKSIAEVLTGLLGQAGIGNPTLAGLLDQFGLGEQSVGELATGLLHAAGMTDTSITGLLGQLGVGDLTLGDALKDLVHATAGGDATITDLLSQFGGADMTLGSVINPLLDASGFGDQSLAELIDSLLGGMFGGGGAGSMTVGDLVIEILQGAGYDMSLSELLQSAEMSNMTLGDLLEGTEIGDQKFTDLLTQAGMGDKTLLELADGAIPVPDITCPLLPGLYNVSCYQTLNSLMGPNSLLETLQRLYSAGAPALGVAPGTPLSDITIGQLLGATGVGGEKLSELLTGLNLSTPFDTVMHNLGLDSVTLSGLLNNGFSWLMNTSVVSMLSSWGLNNLNIDTVIDRLGLDVTINGLLGNLGLNNVDIGGLIDHVLGGMTLGSIANDLGLNNIHLDGFLESLLGGAKVGDLLDDLNLNSVHLDEILQRLLGGVTVNDIANSLGLGSVTVDSLVASLGLTGLTVNDVIDNLGLGGLDLDDLLSNMGISGTDLISVSIGQLGGLFGF